jgi:hypothetical protein
MNNKNNNSISHNGESKIKAQEKTAIEPEKKVKIMLATGSGTTSNQLTQHMVDYSTLSAKIKGFEVINTPYIDGVVVDKNTTKLSPEDALKHSYVQGKQKAQWFIAGCFEPAIRRTENLKYRSAIVLDLDSYKGSVESLEAEIRAELAEYTYIAYSTASHTPELPKVRIFLPTAENIATEDYKQISSQFVSGLSFKSAVDAASFKPNQFMFFSSQINITGLPEGVEQPEYHKWVIENEAALLEPDKFKKAANSNTEAITNKHVETSNSTQSKSINVSQKQVTESLEEYKASGLSYDEWREVLMAIHHFYNGSEQGLAVADEWSKQDAQKYKDFEEIKYKWQSFGNQGQGEPVTFLTILKRIKDIKLAEFEKNIIQHIEDLTPKVKDDILIPVIKSIAEHCSDQEGEYYLQIVKDKTQLRIVTLRSMLRKERKKIAVEDFKQRSDNGYVYPLDEALPAMMFDEFAENRPPKPTIENFKKLINAYGIKIVRNVVSKRDRIILPNDRYLDETGDAARLVRMESLITANNFAGNKRIAPDLCTEEASLNPYNPISNWIKSKQWDGEDRLQAMYDTIATPEYYKKEHKEFFLRKWFISFIAAMEEPQGVFSKGVLIFQGEQSIGKTSWFKKLLPKPVSEYFLEGATLDPTSKDSKATVTSHAIVELGEADSTMKKDIAAIKAFLTSNKDVFRPSYGRVDNKLPRRTVFCASVNDNEYLVDPTGNSRFWTIPVVSLDYKHEIDMQQFWAQILTYYDAGEIWWLQQEDEKILNSYNEDHVKTCPYTELLTARYVFPNKSDQDPENQRYSATDIYRCLDMKVNERTGAIEVARVMKKLGAYRSTDDRKFLVRNNPDYKPINTKSELFNDEPPLTT